MTVASVINMNRQKSTANILSILYPISFLVLLALGVRTISSNFSYELIGLFKSLSLYSGGLYTIN